MRASTRNAPAGRSSRRWGRGQDRASRGLGRRGRAAARADGRDRPRSARGQCDATRPHRRVGPVVARERRDSCDGARADRRGAGFASTDLQAVALGSSRFGICSGTVSCMDAKGLVERAGQKLTAADGILREQGLAGLSMIAVSEAAGAPIGNIYRRFRGTEDILASNTSRSRSLRVSSAARRNSARASVPRPSFASRSPRTAGSR